MNTAMRLAKKHGTLDIPKGGPDLKRLGATTVARDVSVASRPVGPGGQN